MSSTVVKRTTGWEGLTSLQSVSSDQVLQDSLEVLAEVDHLDARLRDRLGILSDLSVDLSGLSEPDDLVIKQSVLLDHLLRVVPVSLVVDVPLVLPNRPVLVRELEIDWDDWRVCLLPLTSLPVSKVHDVAVVLLSRVDGLVDIIRQRVLLEILLWNFVLLLFGKN